MQQIDSVTSKIDQSKYNYYNISAIDSDSDSEMSEDYRLVNNPEDRNLHVYHPTPVTAKS